MLLSIVWIISNEMHKFFWKIWFNFLNIPWQELELMWMISLHEKYRSYSDPHFPTFRLNTERYGVMRKMRTKNADIRIPTLTQFPLFSVIANFMKIKLRMLENFLEIWNIRYFLVVFLNYYTNWKLREIIWS